MCRLSSELVEARDSVERSRQAGVRMEEELRGLQEMLRKRQEELEMLVQQLERTQVDGVTAETKVGHAVSDQRVLCDGYLRFGLNLACFKRFRLDKVKDDIKEKGLSADDVYDRATWRRMSSYIDPT